MVFKQEALETVGEASTHGSNVDAWACRSCVLPAGLMINAPACCEMGERGTGGGEGFRSGSITKE